VRTVNVYDAKTQLSRLLESVERGEEIVIARAGRPVARLVPIAAKPRRVPGAWAGRWVLADDWDSSALGEQIADAFEGGPIFPASDGTS
jgi:prevent-host-death family protein